ncbi:putative metal-dependent hydrolase with the TIM-barrel fold protein [Anopheles sinensis]|uniref:Putative metal-dependent hydrolase with the TIM-barrel fold protein n=1 Tax=Anopheles sinensis TaxID=74873 RepID=A0A084VRZ5_ANOSI|nr:putative metal-dependent hydrolase with the TIM-barrel fold protein [Anopheles sinensis]
MTPRTYRMGATPQCGGHRITPRGLLTTPTRMTRRTFQFRPEEETECRHQPLCEPLDQVNPLCVRLIWYEETHAYIPSKPPRPLHGTTEPPTPSELSLELEPGPVTKPMWAAILVRGISPVKFARPRNVAIYKLVAAAYKASPCRGVSHELQHSGSSVLVASGLPPHVRILHDLFKISHSDRGARLIEQLLSCPWRLFAALLIVFGCDRYASLCKSPTANISPIPWHVKRPLFGR